MRAEFERTTTSERLQVYCTTACQYTTRSEEYRNRPDIIATLLENHRGGAIPDPYTFRDGHPDGPTMRRPRASPPR